MASESIRSRCRADLSALSDTRIQRIVKEGGSALGLSPTMPPWGGVLKDNEIVDLTAYIRTLSKQKDGKK